MYQDDSDAILSVTVPYISSNVHYIQTHNYIYRYLYKGILRGKSMLLCRFKK